MHVAGEAVSADIAPAFPATLKASIERNSCPPELVLKVDEMCFFFLSSFLSSFLYSFLSFFPSFFLPFLPFFLSFFLSSFFIYFLYLHILSFPTERNNASGFEAGKDNLTQLLGRNVTVLQLMLVYHSYTP